LPRPWSGQSIASSWSRTVPSSSTSKFQSSASSGADSLGHHVIEGPRYLPHAGIVSSYSQYTMASGCSVWRMMSSAMAFRAPGFMPEATMCGRRAACGRLSRKLYAAM